MSIQAVGWAIEQQDVTEPVTRLVLICLANYAGADGNGACPSVLRLARDSGLSERAVQLHLRKLEAATLIRRGNQAFAAAVIRRSDRRPTVYNLVIARGAPDSPRKTTGCTGEHHGVNGKPSRGARGAPDPSESVREPKRASKTTWEAEFEQRFGARPPLPGSKVKQ